LKELGVGALGHRRKLLDAISAFRVGAGTGMRLGIDATIVLSNGSRRSTNIAPIAGCRAISQFDSQCIAMNRKQRRAAGKLSRIPSDGRAGTTTPIPSAVTEILAAGLQHHRAGRLAEAATCYRRVLAAQPNRAEVRSNLGVALMDQGKLDEAIAEYHQAIRINPDNAVAHANLGLALAEQGGFELAFNSFEKSIELAPRRAVTYRFLAEVKRFTAGDQHLAAMESLARDVELLSAEDQIDLHFALGKAYADVGDHERSFRNLLRGNALKRQRITYDAAGTRDLFRRIQEVFSRELISSKRSLGDPSTKPVFIVGMPRSGSTLVEQILASHPSVYAAGELDYAGMLMGPEPAATLRSGGSVHFPELVRSMDGEHLRQFAASYVTAISALAPHAERIVDKLPTNFLLAGLIHMALPNARIIHTCRNPIDTCLSCFARLFSQKHLFSYDLAELGDYYRGYENLMEHWRRVLPPGIMLDVQYEDVTVDLETEARRIVAHCGLEWNDACLTFHKTERPVRTTIQVRRAIYRSSVGRWRAYKDHLEPLIRALGRQFERADTWDAPIPPRLLGEGPGRQKG
jgi:tetratricopeptide (TPR) repeat protein